jgi:DNA-directed RNA polymerase subunit RPC12/RpoP
MNTMTDETHVDGNALGGLLHEAFGREMTDARGCCAMCGTVVQVGAMRVYRSAGDVVRCPTCGNVTIVAVVIRERTRVHLGGVRWIEPAPN